MGDPQVGGVSPKSTSAGPEPGDGELRGHGRPLLHMQALFPGGRPGPESPRPQSSSPDLCEAFHAGRATPAEIDQVFVEALRQHPESRFLQTLYAQHVQLKSSRQEDPTEGCR
jgi:hypothetical protein